MRRALSLLFILFFAFSGYSLAAQEDNNGEENPDEAPPDSEWEEIVSSPFSAGDRNFTITLGVLIPAFFSGVDNNEHGLSVGGTGSLTFNYFITQSIFAGGELAGSFSSTRGGNMLYIIPFGLRVGYQFWYRRFEFPVSLMFGAAPQRYLEKAYFGFILKPGASIFWRFNPEWSFGFNANWWFLPQWPKNGNNSIGNFVELTLSARYHF